MSIKDGQKKINKDAGIIKKQNNISFDNDIVHDILFENINNFNNIIFITDKSADNGQIAEYFENCIKNTPKITVSDDEINNIKNNTVNIIPEISGKNLVNISEQILYGTKSFIIGLHLNSYNNVLEKLKTIIALNSNLNDTHINTILSEINAVILNIKYDASNNLSVYSIDKIKSDGLSLQLKNLYTYFEEKNINLINIEPSDNQKNQIIQMQLNDSGIELQKSDEESNKDNILSGPPEQKEILLYSDNTETKNSFEEPVSARQPDNTANTQETGRTKKINKYKLLKEKIKNRKKS